MARYYRLTLINYAACLRQGDRNRNQRGSNIIIHFAPPKYRASATTIRSVRERYDHTSTGLRLEPNLALKGGDIIKEVRDGGNSMQ